MLKIVEGDPGVGHRPGAEQIRDEYAGVALVVSLGDEADVGSEEYLIYAAPVAVIGWTAGIVALGPVVTVVVVVIVIIIPVGILPVVILPAVFIFILQQVISRLVGTEVYGMRPAKSDFNLIHGAGMCLEHLSEVERITGPFSRDCRSRGGELNHSFFYCSAHTPDFVFTAKPVYLKVLKYVVFEYANDAHLHRLESDGFERQDELLGVGHDYTIVVARQPDRRLLLGKFQRGAEVVLHLSAGLVFQFPPDYQFHFAFQCFGGVNAELVQVDHGTRTAGHVRQPYKAAEVLALEQRVAEGHGYVTFRAAHNGGTQCAVVAQCRDAQFTAALPVDTE